MTPKAAGGYYVYMYTYISVAILAQAILAEGSPLLVGYALRWNIYRCLFGVLSLGVGALEIYCLLSHLCITLSHPSFLLNLHFDCL